MKFKQVYLYDGTPYLAFKNKDGEYDYPNDEWTEVAPPEGIYSPFYFNSNEWVGSTKEEYEKSLPKGEKTQPSTSEIMMSSTQMQVAESSFQLRETQQKLAETMMDNAEKDKRLESLEQQQAQVLLELAKIKGEE
ncbi:Uncharacterised protein [Streptococcus equi subsp. equi]|nr:Uncharacterised protein [Streptococcus equi subsp. equi]